MKNGWCGNSIAACFRGTDVLQEVNRIKVFL